MRKNKLNISVSYQELLLVILFMFVVSSSMAGPDDFVFTVDTRISTDNESFTIPTYDTGYKYDVDCDNDGIFEAINQTTAYTCDYSMGGAGRNVILIKDNTDDGNGFPRFRFNEFGEEAEIIELNNWGTGVWDSMDSAFEDAVNMVVIASDWPDLSQVSSVSKMFLEAALVNPNTSNWNTSNITDMSFMFANVAAADPDTSGWNTSNVTDMRNLFFGASVATPDTSNWDMSQVTDISFMFLGAQMADPNTSDWDTGNVTSMRNTFAGALVANPDVSDWDTANVRDMGSMFSSALLATPDTSSWNTSSVTNMSFMFNAARTANPDVSGWDTANVTDMRFMFSNADVANPDTSDWDTANVTDMDRMFSNAVLADPDTGSWDISKVAVMANMFSGVTLPIASYDSILTNFSAQMVLSGVQFNGGNSLYCASSARDDLIVNDDWIITDGGMASESICDELDIIFRISFEVPVVTFTANLKWFEYDFEQLETVEIGIYPELIGVGLDQDGQITIKFHIRKVNQQLQIRISDLDIDAFESVTWIEHQWQNINSSGLTEITWLQY